MASYFPKALLYREWREGRLIFILAAVATFIGPITQVWQYLSIPRGTPYTDMNLYNFWQNFYEQTTASGPITYPFWYFILIWVAVPVLRIVSDRSRGGLLVTLSSPVKRSDWIRVKYFIGLSVLLGAMAIYFMLQWALHFQTPSYISTTTTAELFRSAGIRCIVYAACYSIGFLVALCVTNTVAAVLMTFGVMFAPTWLSTVVSQIMPEGMVSFVGQAGLGMPHGDLAYDLQFLSPLSVLSSQIQDALGQPLYFTWANAWVYWYIALAILAYFVARYHFWRMKAEEFQNFLTASYLWYWLLTGVSLVIGSLIGGTTESLLQYQYTDVFDPVRRSHLFTTGFVIGTVVVWLAVWAVGRFYGLHIQRMGRRSRFGAKSA